jgi:hypothetical protein
MTRPPFADLTFADFPQFSHCWRLALYNALNHLHSPSNHGLSCNLVCSSRGLDLDHANSWIVFATIVCTVAEVAEPRLQSRGVVFLDSGAVGEDAGFAGDGGPLAAVVEEGDVDGGVGGDIVGLAGFGVGVEDEVDAAGFLYESFVSADELRASE